MKELDTKEMDIEEQELYVMLRSKFNPKEMKRLAELMIIDGEKYHQEKLNNNIALGDVSGNWIKQEDRDIMDTHVGSTVLLRFKDSANGVTIDDGTTVDISWLRDRGKGIIHTTCGSYSVADIEEYKAII